MKAPQRGFLLSWLQWRPLASLLVLWALLAAPAAQGQVVDDSTKVIYGPKTTRIVYEAEVLRDSTGGTPLDTTLTRWPQARFWFHDTTYQQDLGTVGSASRPLLYQPNLQLGARFGRNVFDKYARDASAVPYYDSRSPYSFFRVVQSGAGEQVFEISYSRSLKKNFSIGLAYERIASNKVLAARGSRDGLVEHSNLLLFGRYQSDNERYHLLFNVSNVRHRALEQGGIRPLITRTPRASRPDSVSGETRPQDLFKYAEQQVYLTQAANREDRDELYFTQTYRLLGRGLTVYHTFDAKRQYNSYSDVAVKPSGMPGSFYPQVRNSPTVTLDRAQYNQVENTVGVLGRTKAVEYRLYARDRIASLSSQTLAPAATATSLPLIRAAATRNFNEVFLGGTAAFNYRTIYAVETAGELHALSLAGDYPNYPEYWLRGAIRTGPLSVEALINSYSPTLTQQEFVGNHYAWNHLPGGGAAFNNTSTSQLTARLRLKLPDVARLTEQHFEASGGVVNIGNVVYYDTLGRPAQLAATRTLVIGTARYRVRLGRVNFDNQATYTKGGNVEGLRIPSLVTTSRVFYESYIFGKALFSQVGVEMYYQSRFRAYDYSPSTQQFFQQNHFTIRNYPVVDLFFVADIKAVTIFLKAAYINQGIMHNGYFASPYYTGYPRRLQLGVKWNFFN